MEPSSLSMHVTHRTCTTIKYNKVTKEVPTGFFFIVCLTILTKKIGAKSTCSEIECTVPRVIPLSLSSSHLRSQKD